MMGQRKGGREERLEDEKRKGGWKDGREEEKRERWKDGW